MALSITTTTPDLVEGAIAHPWPFPPIVAQASNAGSGKLIYFDYVISGWIKTPQLIAPQVVTNYRYFIPYDEITAGATMRVNANQQGYLTAHNIIEVAASGNTITFTPTIWGEMDNEGNRLYSVGDTNARRFEHSSRRSQDSSAPLPNTIYTEKLYAIFFVGLTDADGQNPESTYAAWPVRAAFYNLTSEEGVDPADQSVRAQMLVRTDEYPTNTSPNQVGTYISTLRDTRIEYTITLETGVALTEIALGGFRLDGTDTADPRFDSQFFQRSFDPNAAPAPTIGSGPVQPRAVSSSTDVTAVGGDLITLGDVPTFDPATNTWEGDFTVKGSALIPGRRYRFTLHATADDGRTYPIRTTALIAVSDPPAVSGNITVGAVEYSSNAQPLIGTSFSNILPGARLLVTWSMDKSTYNDRAQAAGYSGGIDDHFQRVQVFLSDRRPLDEETLRATGTALTPTATKNNGQEISVSQEFRVPQWAAGRRLYLTAIYEFSGKAAGSPSANNILVPVALQIRNSDSDFTLTEVRDQDGNAVSIPFCLEDAETLSLCFDTPLDPTQYDFFATFDGQEENPFDSPFLPALQNDVIVNIDDFTSPPGCVELDTSLFQPGRRYCVNLYATRKAAGTDPGLPAQACTDLEVDFRLIWQYRKTEDRGSVLGIRRKDRWSLDMICQMIFKNLPAGVTAQDLQITARASAENLGSGDIDFPIKRIGWTEAQMFGSASALQIVRADILKFTAHEKRWFIDLPYDRLELDYDIDISFQNDGTECSYTIAGCAGGNVVPHRDPANYDEVKNDVGARTNGYSARCYIGPDPYDEFYLEPLTLTPE